MARANTPLYGGIARPAQQMSTLEVLPWERRHGSGHGFWLGESLKKLRARKGHQFVADDVSGTDAPETPSKDTTDAHLVALAKRHGLKLATLDTTLAAKPWAAGVAENPLAASLKPA